jgi:hypothetical protein
MISTSFFSHACLLAMVVAFLANLLCVGDGSLGADGEAEYWLACVC